MFKVMHYKLFYQDTMCVDLQTHLALSLCTGEMGHTKSRKKSEAEKIHGEQTKLLESSEVLHGVVTLPQCPFSLLFPQQMSRKKGTACPTAF